MLQVSLRRETSARMAESVGSLGHNLRAWPPGTVFSNLLAEARVPEELAGNFVFSFGRWRGSRRARPRKHAFSSGPAGTRTRDLRIKSARLSRHFLAKTAL